jgi:cell shape-determining protein MreD
MSFVLGLFLDGTHLSLPPCFHAFFALGSVFLLQLLHRQLRLENANRLLVAIVFLTIFYYGVLSAVAPSASPCLVLRTYLLSGLFGICAWFFFRKCSFAKKY